MKVTKSLRHRVETASAGLRAAVVVAIVGSGTAVHAQSGGLPDPRAAQPERPTVATHAFTVAPGIIELEAGAQDQAVQPSTQILTPILFKIGLTSRLQLDLAPGWQRNAASGTVQSGLTDLVVGVKWRVADRVPMLGAFAFQSSISLPTGSAERGTGTGTEGLYLLFISSHSVRGVSLDVNLGYTRRGGDGTTAPKNSTLWTVAAGVPVHGRASWAAEVYGYPGTAGPAGAAPIVAFLTGPTFALRKSLVLDAGVILTITGDSGTAAYGGVTWNIGRLWTPRR